MEKLQWKRWSQWRLRPYLEQLCRSGKQQTRSGPSPLIHANWVKILEKHLKKSWETHWINATPEINPGDQADPYYIPTYYPKDMVNGCEISDTERPDNLDGCLIGKEPELSEAFDMMGGDDLRVRNAAKLYNAFTKDFSTSGSEDADVPTTVLTNAELTSLKADADLLTRKLAREDESR